MAFSDTPVTSLWVATGRDYPDALVTGAAAGADRAPVLVVDGRASRLRASTATLVKDLAAPAVHVAGGTAAVGAALVTDLATVSGVDVQRHAGADRYATAVAVNRAAHPELTAGSAFIASGTGFADALAGSFYAARAGRPLYLSVPYCVPPVVRPELTRAAVTTVRLLGGVKVLRGLVGTLEACRSLGAASSLWVVVNKHRPLSPLKYVPSGLVVPAVTYPQGERMRKDAAAALVTMFRAGKAAGAGSMAMASGYRSYATQYSVYWHRVSTHGRAYADAWIARPGYSEHQTGLTLDIEPVGSSTCSAHNCLGSTSQGRWLRSNAWRYGFVLRYESGYTGVTGYNPEPWHFRYVGTPVSTDYHAGGWHTLEQYFGLPAAPTY